MLQQADLDARCRATVLAALEADPALAEELAAIVAVLRPAAERRFWSAFAEECSRRGRPAAAVLTALERAAVR